MKKNIKGITLVSLVITIIVMLILAGVSISMATGNNGVLTRGQQAATKTTLGTILDELNMAATSVDTDYQSEWAMDPSVFATKWQYVTVKKINSYLVSAKIINKATAGSAGGVGIVNGKADSTTFAAIADLSTNKKLDSSDKIGGTTNTVPYNCGRVISALYLTDTTKPNASGEYLPGKAVYVALFYMNSGIPVFVDVGVISEECEAANNVTGSLVLDQTTSGNATGKITLSAATNITWLRNAEAGKTGVPAGQK